MSQRVRIKRVYAGADADDGYRVLVDRVWPRGVAKERAAVDEWLPDVGPSTALRTWFAHDPARWDEFVRRYEAELAERAPLVERLLERADAGTLTLVYSARDEEHNQAVALAAYLKRSLS